MARTRLFQNLSRLTAEAFQQPMTRRAFLKRGAALAVSAALWPLLESRHTVRAGETVSPVVIVGAGLGGLVTAYALSRRGIPCEIYEASARVGGRAYTHRNFNGEGMFCELGGELVDSNHEELIGLCAELNLPLERFEPADQGLEPEIFYREGQQAPVAALTF